MLGSLMAYWSRSSLIVGVVSRCIEFVHIQVRDVFECFGLDVKLPIVFGPRRYLMNTVIIKCDWLSDENIITKCQRVCFLQEEKWTCLSPPLRELFMKSFRNALRWFSHGLLLGYTLINGCADECQLSYLALAVTLSSCKHFLFSSTAASLGVARASEYASSNAEE